jgi:hypothetical protein
VLAEFHVHICGFDRRSRSIWIVIAKEAISIAANRPDNAPTSSDAGGSLRSMLSSCPASPPSKEVTITFQVIRPDGNVVSVHKR